jgi:nitrogen fixation NifU-like protein
MVNENMDPFDVIQEKIDNDMEARYSKKTIEYANNPLNMGRMNDPSGSAWIKGLCGDTMEIYLIIKEKRISEATFFTDGCGVTIACGSVVTESVKNKTIDEVLSIAPGDIIDHLGGLPSEHIHCAILAVSTLHKAIADYLLKY